MADHSAIEWTEATWNPTAGCDRVLSGCDHCYALMLAKRPKAMGGPKYQTDGNACPSGPSLGLALHLDALRLPYRWRAPQVDFVNSMSDVSGGFAIFDRSSVQVNRHAAGLRRVREVSGTCPTRGRWSQ
ncbi:DUF5131 family protein [Nonomuraea basaltis]|uniref:DUF5131 family protein n=1 Tax=Nonomuraea basaltis TaxID=2495887 RepID=UPI00110C6A30|nr:DUF5131 family protein [Nonomuraea basaltis]